MKSVVIKRKDQEPVTIQHNSDSIVFSIQSTSGNLYCYVPVPVWWEAWQNLKNVTPDRPQRWVYRNNEVVLQVETALEEKKSSYVLDFYVQIFPLNIEENFSLIREFSDKMSPPKESITKPKPIKKRGY